ncbi:MAG: HD domain-containing phosphohydrolase [Myxococcota bacterium]
MARILIVDDELHIRTLLRRLLQREGHECEMAATADEAWERLEQEGFDLVLSDVNMPGTSGLELAPRIADKYPSTPVVMVTGVDDPHVARNAVESGAYGYIIKPFEPNEIVIGVMNALRRRELELQNRRHQEELESLVDARTQELQDTFEELKVAHMDLKSAQEETINRLSIASEYRDEETGAHIQRMSRYCELLGRKAGMPEDQVELVRTASPLHDVGKIGIPDAILQKPGKHTPDEWQIMKTHAEIGYRILAGSGYEVLELAAVIARTHHEKWDSSGYPLQLGGEDIPLVGRITAIADVFDALTTRRVYKPAFTPERSIALMREGRGRHFDPNLLDVFLDSIDEVLAIREAFPDEEAPPPY